MESKKPSALRLALPFFHARNDLKKISVFFNNGTFFRIQSTKSKMGIIYMVFGISSDGFFCGDVLQRSPSTISLYMKAGHNNVLWVCSNYEAPWLD